MPRARGLVLWVGGVTRLFPPFLTCRVTCLDKGFGMDCGGTRTPLKKKNGVVWIGGARFFLSDFPLLPTIFLIYFFKAFDSLAVKDPVVGFPSPHLRDQLFSLLKRGVKMHENCMP